jgi:hypothetical protein
MGLAYKFIYNIKGSFHSESVWKILYLVFYYWVLILIRPPNFMCLIFFRISCIIAYYFTTAAMAL